MAIVFVAGSMNIKRLDPKFVVLLEKIVASEMDIVVGDADGADTSIQNFLLEVGASAVTVYCSGDQPRNNAGSWPVHAVHSDAKPGTRAFFTAKDVEMAKAADYGLMVWNAKSVGTLSNVIELIKRDKKCVVFVNRDKAIKTIAGAADLRRLLSLMSPAAKIDAEGKMNLSAVLSSLENQQWAMPI